jgi:hypothetical protein
MTRTTGSRVGGSESPPVSLGTERVADILEEELDPTIKEWIKLVEKEPDLIRIVEFRRTHRPSSQTPP